MTQFFHRPALSDRITKLLLTDAIGTATTSGLFVAAPRRTGKSTFMREDLRPQLAKAGAQVIYVDLWADKEADPGGVIVAAVRAELAHHDGVTARLARGAGMEKVTVGGDPTFSLDRVGLGADVSLSAALAALSDEVKKPIVLIIDEAQHAITTENGYNALFALKAARDELNSSGHFGLRIVATGSNSDKLAMLRNSKDQAFFGAALYPFPALDREYVAWFCRGVNLPGPLDVDAVDALFDRAGRRPEILGAAADALRFDFGLAAKDVSARFAEAVDEQIQAAESQSLRVLHGLTALQSSVLRVMAAWGSRFAPFEEQTLAAYEAVLKATSPSESSRPETSSVQTALQALQDRSLIWRERRGIYSIEEASLAALMLSEGLLDAVPPAPEMPKLSAQGSRPK